MPIVDNRTANRDYLLPFGDNDLGDDVARIIATINAIDVDVAAVIAALAGKASAIHAHAISDVTGLAAALASKLDAGAGVSIAQVTGLQTALEGKAPLASPQFTGAPAGPTPDASENSTRLATTQWVKQNFLSGVPDNSVGTSKIVNKNVTLEKFSDAPALSVLARATNTSGARTDIEAGAANTIFSRIANALGFNTLTALLDAAFGNTRGMLLRRGAAAWEALALGASGKALVSNGTDALWGDAGAMTLLGTIATTSGTSQSISGLDLTGFKFLVLDFRGVSATGGGDIRIGGNLVVSVINGSTLINGQLMLSLASGWCSGVLGGANVTANSGYSTASTSVGLTITGASFDAGAVDVYGMK